jgi:hypothetical protein
MSKVLRGYLGRIRNFVINAQGDVFCTLDDTYVVPKRVVGRKKKYLEVQLMRAGTIKWYSVHRLMAFSWLGPPSNIRKNVVDHIDGDSMNNNIENLRWVTHTANNINKRCYGLAREGKLFIPKIAGYRHTRFATEDEELCHMLRAMLVESYVRYNCRFPENGNAFPHSSIHNY